MYNQINMSDWIKLIKFNIINDNPILNKKLIY